MRSIGSPEKLKSRLPSFIFFWTPCSLSAVYLVVRQGWGLRLEEAKLTGGNSSSSPPQASATGWEQGAETGLGAGIRLGGEEKGLGAGM